MDGPKDFTFPDADLLKFAIENGMLDTALVQKEMERTKDKEILATHNNSIWQGSNGKWYTYLPDKKQEGKRKLVKRSTKEDVEKAVIEFRKNEKRENVPTVRDVFTQWNDKRLAQQRIAPSTHQRNKQTFDRHFKKFGNRKMKNVHPEEITDFLEWQVCEYNLTSKDFSNLKTITRGFLKYARKQKLIYFNVESVFQELDVSDMRFKKVVKEDYQEVFDESEMDTMIDFLTAHPDSHNLGLLLMFLTGIRIGELVALKRIDIDEDTVRIRRTETKYPGPDGKEIYEVKDFPKSDAGIRDVVVPLDYQWVLKKILAISPEEEYVFTKNKKRMTTNCFRARLRRNCEKVGIYKKSPHKIRKTYGTILLDNHIDRCMVISQMGHADILCTEKYYHRDRRKKDEKLKIISEIKDFQDKKRDNQPTSNMHSDYLY